MIPHLPGHCYLIECKAFHSRVCVDKLTKNNVSISTHTMRRKLTLPGKRHTEPGGRGRRIRIFQDHKCLLVKLRAPSGIPGGGVVTAVL